MDGHYLVVFSGEVVPLLLEMGHLGRAEWTKEWRMERRVEWREFSYWTICSLFSDMTFLFQQKNRRKTSLKKGKKFVSTLLRLE